MKSLALAIAALATVAAVQSDVSDADTRRASEQAARALADGREAAAWTLLRQSTDNSVRSFLIHDLAKFGVNSNLIARRLQNEPDASVRRALILALGSYGAEALPDSQRQSLVSLLLGWYKNDPDPGVHSAIGWLVGPTNRDAPRLDWGQHAAVKEMSQSWRGRPASEARWYVTAEGQTISILRGPVSVRMGSLPGEPGRQSAPDSPAEPVHTVTIPRSIAMSTTEITVAEFRRFLDANPDAKEGFVYPDQPNRMAEVMGRFSPEEDGPVIAVTWYEAAMYCNWLSAREGIPQPEWVYPAIIKDGMAMPRDYLHRTGYRLPTEAEWEYAARAETTTARFFGASVTLLSEYAWFARHPPRKKSDPADPNDPQQTARVGGLRPNDFGLFDVYGNVWEWTQDRVVRHQRGDVRDDVEDTVLPVWDADARTRRGGAFPYEAAMARSAARGTLSSLPTNRRDNVGFRVARTIR